MKTIYGGGFVLLGGNAIRTSIKEVDEAASKDLLSYKMDLDEQCVQVSRENITIWFSTDKELILETVESFEEKFKTMDPTEFFESIKKDFYKADDGEVEDYVVGDEGKLIKVEKDER